MSIEVKAFIISILAIFLVPILICGIEIHDTNYDTEQIVVEEAKV